MAKFLNTSATNYYLEELIKGASDRLILISPFLKLNDPMTRGHEAIYINFKPSQKNCRRYCWLMPILQTLLSLKRLSFDVN